MTPLELLAARRESGYTKRFGIGTADVYLKQLRGCQGGVACPVGDVDWDAAIKDAAKIFTYHNPDMEIGEKRRKEATEGAVMDFDMIISSMSKDRDGDILVSKGATVDPKAPLLWQHFPFEPIGRVTDARVMAKKITGSASIIDSPKGRDAAQLVEFGALRISHGFSADEFEPLEGDDERGFRVLKFEIMEVSLVSVPSNTDAIITAFSQGKLHDPLIKHWAKGYYDARPAQSPGVTFTKASTELPPNSVKEEIGDYKQTIAFENADDLKEHVAKEKPVVCDTAATHTLDKDGNTIPVPTVVIGTVIADKGQELGEVKSGRSLSKANEKKLRSAAEALQKAAESILDVLASVDPEEDEERSFKQVAGEAVSMLLTCDEKDADAMLKASEQIKSAIDMLSKHVTDQELELLLT